jgi:hypothetical protein
MSGGTISGNTGTAAVCIDLCAAFTMTGGSIKNNNGRAVSLLLPVSSSTSMNGALYTEPDGGVFNMTGGEIKGNGIDGDGGAVYLNFRTYFYMKGGEISGNFAAEKGGGVFINNFKNPSNENYILQYKMMAYLDMQGGVISGNTAVVSGEDLYIPAVTTFTMQGTARVGRLTLTPFYSTTNGKFFNSCITISGDFIGTGTIATIDIVDDEVDSTWFNGRLDEYPPVIRLSGGYTGLNYSSLMPAGRFVLGYTKKQTGVNPVIRKPLTNYEIDNSTGLLTYIGI